MVKVSIVVRDQVNIGISIDVVDVVKVSLEVVKRISIDVSFMNIVKLIFIHMLRVTYIYKR